MISLLVYFALLGSTAATSPHAVPKAEWDALNSTVGGRLTRGVPFARACFENVGANVTSGGPDCASVQANYGSGDFRAGLYGATMKTQWEICQKTDQGCLLDSTTPTNATAFSPPRVCNQGSVAHYYIDVREASDATQGFAFSKRTGVPLVIKNSGHDFIGRSSAPGSLALWVHNIQYINYSTSFVPEGCKTKALPGLTYGAGQDLQSLFSFAEANNITFVGGSSFTVAAAGGWVQGGGHSILTNTHGLGVDRVLQFRVVTPDGKLRVANACQNKDLFWALRGGGGGTFGVVLEATSEVIPNALSTMTFRWDLAPTPGNIRKLIEIVAENSVQWSREGWGGYIYATTSTLANPRLNQSDAEASMKPLTDFLKVATDGAGGGPGTGAQVYWTRYPSFLPLWQQIMSTPVSAGTNTALSSRLIPRSLFKPSTTAALVNATVEAIMRAGGVAAVYLVTPFSYPDPKLQTSVTPLWRTAVWHVVTLIDWPWDGGLAGAKAAYAKASDAIKPLRDLTPGGGAYQNEADVYEPAASASFWGTNYPALLAIKKKYDPNGLLDCWHCVGWKGNTTSVASCYL
ncbi:FAD-binding domain-containing protein [Ceratobasidium sp. AG-I]|nr:FAD-binding domain-containing protein [Ceratobasidium sp. AG-I]